MTRSRSACSNGSWECHMFIKNGDHVALKKHLSLTNFNTNIRFQNETLLTTAIKSGSSQIVKIILSHGADPNLKSPENGRNEPPLITATRWKSIEIVKLLIESGADIKHTAFYGHDAIFQSVVENAFDILEYLLEKSVHKKSIHEARNCPLLIALKYADRFNSKRKCLLTLLRQNYICHCFSLENPVKVSFLDSLPKLLNGNCILRVLKSSTIEPSNNILIFSSSLRLVNLTREAIRQNVCKTSINYTASIRTLPLPLTLTNFLLYKDIYDVIVRKLSTQQSVYLISFMQ